MDSDHGIPTGDESSSPDSGMSTGWTEQRWPAGWTVRHIAETGSTNFDLLAAAERGDAGHRSVMVTDHQTAGRGRLSRTWDAPPGANLLTSFLFVSDRLDPHRCSQLIGLAAVDAVETIVGESLTSRLGLKWPNDVLLDGAKLAGVLAVRSSQVDATVVGIGLNVGWAPDDAAAINQNLGVSVEPPAVLRAMIDAIDELTDTAADSDRVIDDRYRDRLLTLGQRVRIELPGGRSMTGTAVDLDAMGRIVVDIGGELTSFDVGDVVHLRPG